MGRGVLGFLGTHRGQTRGVGGVGLAAAGEVGVGGGFDLLEHHRLDVQVVGAREIGQVLLGGGARLHAHRGALELFGAGDLALGHHEALPVVVADADEVQAQRGVAVEGVGGVAREHVHLAGLQGREALLGVQGHPLDLRGIGEDGRRQRTAVVHIQAGPVAIAVGLGEARQTGVHAAHHLPTLLDGVQGFAGVGWQAGQCGQGAQRQGGELQGFEFHASLRVVGKGNRCHRDCTGWVHLQTAGRL